MIRKPRALKQFAVVAIAIGLQACASASGPVNEHEAPNRASFDRIFDDVMARYRLPGLAVGIVRDGRIIYQRTGGEVIEGSGRRIDADTLFKIASNSKAMTTAVLARLVDRGKLRWDDPVVKYLPSFKMHDDWVTREMQVRDLLIHNSGLREGAGDLMLWPEPNRFTRSDIIAGLAHLKPQHSFRSTYDYDNLMYVVAGEVAAAVSGVPYEELMRRELFEPLGMSRCQAGGFERDGIGNVAQPHRRNDDDNTVIRADPAAIPVSTFAAAGGIRCSLNDMLKWVTLWLSDDMTPASSATPWLTAARRDELWRAHMPMPISERQRRWDGSRFNAYGYGWRLSDVHGVLRVAHTGTLAGMYSAVTLLPEKNTGFVFMINGEGSTARIVLNQMLVETFTARSERDVASYADELALVSGPQASTAPDVSARTTVAPEAMRPWLGVYRDPWFGEVIVCAAENRVRWASAKSPLLRGTVVTVAERLLIDWDDDDSVDVEPWLDFSTDNDVATMLLTKVDPAADFSSDYEDLRFSRNAACP